MTMLDVDWARDVEPLPHLNGDLASILDTVRSLRLAWKRVIEADPEAFHEARKRSLRRHAIETGVIERLYDLSWGITEALVAEGITAEAAARATRDGVLADDVLELIRSQYDALQFMAEAARHGRDVSISMVKELHVALTRLQHTYPATGPRGITFDARLAHGQWKSKPNSVTRPDGSKLEYCPPDQVAPQMERLVELYVGYEDIDPVVRTAWLHHRFVRIHPFQDGNGRVARCLTLLGLLRADLAPLVVDRRDRDRYLECLDQANDGDLRPLVRFFAELQIIALRSELEAPVVIDASAFARGPLAVLEAGIARIEHREALPNPAEPNDKVHALAETVHGRIVRRLSDTSIAIRQLVEKRLDQEAEVQLATPHFEHEPEVGDVSGHTWLAQLAVEARGHGLEYVVELDKAGLGETGVLTMHVAAVVTSPPATPGRPDTFEQLMFPPTATVTWTHENNPDTHWDQVEHVLDSTLARSLQGFITAL